MTFNAASRTILTLNAKSANFRQNSDIFPESQKF